MEGPTPKEIVAYLDEFIIGQQEAKRAVAIALRNRMRRLELGDDPLKEEIHPKNIIMIGPTGVGKTEIARRLAKLAKAPFIKVEATKYTEVGYVGRDVESMVRDLLAVAMKMVRQEHEEKVREKAEKKAEERILNILVKGRDVEERFRQDSYLTEEEKNLKEVLRKKYRNNALDDREIEVRTQGSAMPFLQIMAVPGLEELEHQMQNVLGDILPRKKETKKMTVAQARKLIIAEETDALLDHEKMRQEAIQLTEQRGIIFIDEIDKIARGEYRSGPDVSREGVQRDILPLVEGTTVNTRQGPVRTDHILFIAAGAFHISRVSDLIPELQGRFPIRVELHPLTKEDYVKILQNPRNALSKQYQALLSTEGIALNFTHDGYEAIAEIAVTMNERQENIGARRLHTIMEKLLEDISFSPEDYRNREVIIDALYVRKQLEHILKDENLARYIL
ncbi:MAG: ATP-dependent protease ATPase subunit HslU [Leptospiraceae bacterium]|nr:ATP-dependent protease ATPase subunit HslU [Leptospiraceae bacterium]MDW8307389.1 ATP-dependent protease ATPase subunit HslU [Leptospiraceae bacterium]